MTYGALRVKFGLEAEQLYKRVLEVSERLLGKDNIFTLNPDYASAVESLRRL